MLHGRSIAPHVKVFKDTPSPSNKKDPAPSEALGLFLTPGALSGSLWVALYGSLSLSPWLWGSLLSLMLVVTLIMPSIMPGAPVTRRQNFVHRRECFFLLLCPVEVKQPPTHTPAHDNSKLIWGYPGIRFLGIQNKFIWRKI